MTTTDKQKCLDELNLWAREPRRLKFITLLREFFDLTSIVLIVRLIDDSELLPDSWMRQHELKQGAKP